MQYNTRIKLNNLILILEIFYCHNNSQISDYNEYV